MCERDRLEANLEERILAMRRSARLTRAMIDAGLEAYSEATPFYYSDEDIVIAIYSAMSALEV